MYGTYDIGGRGSRISSGQYESSRRAILCPTRRDVFGKRRFCHLSQYQCTNEYMPVMLKRILRIQMQNLLGTLGHEIYWSSRCSTSAVLCACEQTMHVMCRCSTSAALCASEQTIHVMCSSTAIIPKQVLNTEDAAVRGQRGI